MPLQISQSLTNTITAKPSTRGVVRPYSARTVSRVARGVCAQSCELLRRVLQDKQCWTYSITFDGCTKEPHVVLGLRLCAPVAGKPHSFLVLITPQENEAAETVYNAVKDIMSSLDPKFMKKVYGVSTDGCPVMTGVDEGVHQKF
eukprot:GHVU01041251.1.p1 GENE.GHVU01041251.1~~GHVU01041251.1.p1  ORF type:complete len:145 (+),score=7.70 GHVU01041251.1:789-1223(+)